MAESSVGDQVQLSYDREKERASSFILSHYRSNTPCGECFVSDSYQKASSGMSGDSLTTSINCVG